MRAIRFVFLLLFVGLISCREQADVAPTSAGEAVETTGMMKMSLDMTNAPSGVTRVTGELYRNDSEEILFDVDIDGSAATALVEDIPVGVWTVKIDALNDDNLIIYTGSSTVTIAAGMVTRVTIRLGAVTGSLQVAVTWANTNAETPPPEWPVLVDNMSPGYVNQQLGTVLNGTSELFPGNGEDPDIFGAPQPDLSPAASILGNWLSSNPVEGNPNWSPLQAVPKHWEVDAEMAVIYPVWAGKHGITGLRGYFGVDNGIFVWVNGVYTFGAEAPFYAVEWEYAGIALGDLHGGWNYIQILLEDQGVENDFTVKIVAPAGETAAPDAGQTAGCHGRGDRRGDHKDETGVRKGLVLFYPFNGNADDLSGNGIDGSVVGATLAADRFGNPASAYSFDGDDYIVADASSLPAQERTVSVWFYANTMDGAPVVLGYGGGCGTSFFMDLNHTETPHCFHIEAHCNEDDYCSPYSSEPVLAWYHWVVTASTSGTRMYLNGKEILSNASYLHTNAAGTHLGIGVIAGPDVGEVPYTDVNVGYFKGLLDDIRVYDRALAPKEILALYHERGWEGNP